MRCDVKRGNATDKATLYDSQRTQDWSFVPGEEWRVGAVLVWAKTIALTFLARSTEESCRKDA